MNEPDVIPAWKAIAAMSLNRVIGVKGRIPWHLPEDFRWFKECTLGGVVVMGRKTFESLGKPLPNRTNIILTHHPVLVKRDYPHSFSGARVRQAAKNRRKIGEIRMAGYHDLRLMASLEMIERTDFPGPVYFCGGAEIYEQALPRCAELLLTRVHREVEGDTFFPPFEHLFERTEIIRERPEFTIERWVRNRVA